MSELTKVGLNDATAGFQMRCIEDVDEEANIEIVAQGERKLSGYVAELTRYETWVNAITQISAANSPLEIDAISGKTILEISNNTKFYMRVKHTASGGSCKIIPVGYSVSSDDLAFGFTPLGEITMAATSCVIEIASSPPVYDYYSHVQAVDACGFTHIHFLVSEITGEGNQVDLWAWPGKPVVQSGGE